MHRRIWTAEHMENQRPWLVEGIRHATGNRDFRFACPEWPLYRRKRLFG